MRRRDRPLPQGRRRRRAEPGRRVPHGVVVPPHPRHRRRPPHLGDRLLHLLPLLLPLQLLPVALLLLLQRRLLDGLQGVIDRRAS